MYLFFLTNIYLFQDTEELFNFIPEPRVTKSAPKNLNFTATTLSRKRTGEPTVLSYIKKPVKRPVKIIRIEIYDADTLQKSEQSVCNCEAEVCVQYVVNGVLYDEIYGATKDVINKIQDSLDSRL